MQTSQDTAEANRLYWETDMSVADIATHFDLSRRALYDVVKPLPAAGECRECGSALHFENRLSRRAGQATCASCQTRQPARRADHDGEPGEEPGEGRLGDRFAAAADRFGWAGDRSGGGRQRAVLLGGAAIAGLALGAWLARRRD